MRRILNDDRVSEEWSTKMKNSLDLRRSNVFWYMLGAIIGDIVGSKYEFNNTLDYDFEMFAEGSDFTDDSICTVAVKKRPWYEY